MSDAKVTFGEDDFYFTCPSGNKCGPLLIAGKCKEKRDPQNQKGGVAQWDWDGNQERPTFSPSIDCKGCWHGFIEDGRCVNVSKVDEQ